MQDNYDDRIKKLEDQVVFWKIIATISLMAIFQLGIVNFANKHHLFRFAPTNTIGDISTNTAEK